MKDSIGIVASGTSLSQMVFYSTNPITTDFVKIKHNMCRTVYRIQDIEIMNKRFLDGDFARYIQESDDYSKYNIYISKAVPIAHINENDETYNDFWYIAPPGSRVTNASTKDISIAYDIAQRESAQKIGYLRKHDNVPVWIELSKLLTTHMAVIGRSGFGKSNFTKIILNNLSLQYMLFTPTNEYVGIKTGKHIDVDKITVPKDTDLIRKLLELNLSETSILNEYLESCVHESIHVSKLADMISTGNEKNSFDKLAAKRSTQAYSLCEKLYAADFYIGVKSNNIPNKSYIFNMQRLSAYELEIVIYLYLNQILNQRRADFKLIAEGESIPNRVVVFLEEAHKYIPSMKTTFCKEVINTIAREGRKLGVHLVLLSQRPRYLDPTTLSQCGTSIIFNISNPDDIEYIMSNANFYGDEYKKNIRSLQIGECLIESDYLKGEMSCKIDLFM